MGFPSTEEFDAATKIKKPSSRRRDLPVGEIFLVIRREYVKRGDELYMILTMFYRQDREYTVWAPQRLGEELMHDYGGVDVYIRSNGLKPTKNDPTHMYYDYDIMKA